MDTFNEFLGRDILEHVSFRSSSQSPVHILFTLVRSQNDETRSRDFLADGTHRLDAVHKWHAQVKKSDIRSSRQKLLDCFAPVAGFGDYVHVGPAINERGQA